MSSANAAAKKRRAPVSNDPPVQSRPNAIPQPGQQMSSQNMNQGLTLPQVIALIDKRLVSLETFVVDAKQSSSTQYNPKPQQVVNTSLVHPSSSNQLNDFNERFDALADEIANMKNIVLSLQSYTMDVNKMLMEERAKMMELSEQLADQSDENSQAPNHHQLFALSDNTSALDNSASLDTIKQLIHNS